MNKQSFILTKEEVDELITELEHSFITSFVVRDLLIRLIKHVSATEASNTK